LAKSHPDLGMAFSFVSKEAASKKTAVYSNAAHGCRIRSGMTKW